MLYGIRTSFTVCIRTCFTHSGGEVTFHGHGFFPLCVTTIGNNLRHLWFGIPPLSDVRGQQSGSMVVHLKVFTNRATHAVRYQDILYSLYRTCFTHSGGEVTFHGHGFFPLCVTTIGNNLRHLWFGIPPLPDVRSQQSGSMIVHLEAVNEPGDACVAPTKIYRTHRAWNAPSAPVPFLCRALPSPSAIIC